MSLVRPRGAGNRSTEKSSQPPAKSNFFTIRTDPIRETVGWLRGKTRRKELLPPCTSTCVQTNPHEPFYNDQKYHTFVYGIRHSELGPLCQLPEGMNYREWMAGNGKQ
ncbi:hypothetical protein ACOME3_009619 [Neoechinorhynchus agilis]